MASSKSKHRGQLAPDNLKRYLYLHVDPKTQSVVYIGKGTGGRAWDCAYTSRGNKQHQAWMVSLLEQGYTPADFVAVLEQNLNEIEAQTRERELIEQHLKSGSPLFNLMQRGQTKQTKLSLEALKQARLLREQGLSYKKIGDQLSVGAMLIYDALNGRTKAYLTMENACAL